jgi:GNAT superfamily N-acetyltransferase
VTIPTISELVPCERLEVELDVIWVRDLTALELAGLESLTMGHSGQMADRLRYVREEDCAQSYAVRAWRGQTLCGWALVFPDHSGPTAFIYVDKSERRKGIGGQLLQRVLTLTPSPYCVPWDPASGGLYARYAERVRIAPGGRRWVRAAA